MPIQVAALLFANVMLTCVAVEAETAKKKKSDGAPTAEQRKKMYKEGLAWCRKLHGAQIHYVRIQKHYGKWKFVCYIY